MTTTTTNLAVELQHKSPTSGARWVKPIGWEPANQIDGSEFLDGSWWDANEETHGLVVFNTTGTEGETIEVSLHDIRLASCGNCRVIGEVKL